MKRFYVKDRAGIYDPVTVEAETPAVARVIGLERMFGCPLAEVRADLVGQALKDIILYELREVDGGETPA